MYLDYYGLSEAPFDITPNPRFLFYSAKHREAINHLLYGIRERKGFVQLTGESVYERYTGALNDTATGGVAAMGAKRVVVRIDVEKVVSWDHSKLGGTY